MSEVRLVVREAGRDWSGGHPLAVGCIAEIEAFGAVPSTHPHGVGASRHSHRFERLVGMKGAALSSKDRGYIPFERYRDDAPLGTRPDFHRRGDGRHQACAAENRE